MFRSTLTTVAAFCLSFASLLILGCQEPDESFAEVEESVPYLSPEVENALLKEEGKKFIIIESEGLPRDEAKTEGERQVSAKEAAALSGRAKLLEITQGALISVRRDGENNKLQVSRVKSRAAGRLRGAKAHSVTYDPDLRIATAKMQLAVTGRRGLYGMLAPLLTRAEPENKYSPPGTIANLQKAYDGLIVDVRGLDFQLALTQYIESEQNEVLYGPHKVSQTIITKRGMADYSTEPGKAKAILSEHGSQTPMTVIAKGLRGNRPQVSADDASRIFAANQKENFLEKARVVFLLAE